MSGASPKKTAKGASTASTGESEATRMPPISARSSVFGVTLKTSHAPAPAAQSATPTDSGEVPGKNVFLAAKSNSHTELGPRNPFGANPKAVVQPEVRKTSLSSAFVRRTSDQGASAATNNAKRASGSYTVNEGSKCLLLCAWGRR